MLTGDRSTIITARVGDDVLVLQYSVFLYHSLIALFTFESIAADKMPFLGSLRTYFSHHEHNWVLSRSIYEDSTSGRRLYPLFCDYVTRFSVSVERTGCNIQICIGTSGQR